MVRDFINYNYLYFSFSPKEFPIALKKIGTYIGKFKNTLSSIQKEVSTATKEIDIETSSNSKDNENKKEIKKNG